MHDSFPKTWMLMLLGAGGAAAGALIYWWGTPSTPESQAFVTSPEFVTWFFVNEVLFAAYPIVAVLVWQPLRRLGKHVRGNLLEIGGSSLILFVLFLLPHFAGTPIVNLQPLPLEYFKTKIVLLMVIGFLASTLPLSAGIWLTQAAIRDTFSRAAPAGEDIKEYIRLRDYLKRFLAALGALLSVFTLAGAALRAAALAFAATTESDYPAVLLLILGVYYTLLLAVVYLPSHLSLAAAGQHLLDVHFALPSPGSAEWTERYTGRSQLKELLELEMSGTQRLLTSLTLLSPFVSGIFSLLVKS